MSTTVMPKRKSVIVLAAAIIFSLAFTFMFSSVAKAEMMPIAVKSNVAELNIYALPLNSSYVPVLDTVTDSEIVFFPEEKVENFYKVKFSGGLFGYVLISEVTASTDIKTNVSLFPGAAIRTEPKATAPVKRMLSTGTEVNLLAQDGDWYQVKAFNGESGYMLKSVLAEVSMETPTYDPDTDDSEYISVSATSGKIRTGAGTGNSVLIEVKTGTVLLVADTVKGSDGATWYKVVVANGKNGYISSSSVKSINGFNALKGKTIVVDPGHGNIKTDKTVDEGNISITKAKEKDINLKVAGYLKEYLEAYGAKVVMTRVDDKSTISLGDRANIANNNNADLFISVHCNSSTKDAAKKGVVTYYFGGDSKDAVSADLSKKRLALANAVNNNTVALNGSDNLGVGSEKFEVLLKTKMPSALVEVGYMSNAAEDALLKTEAYQKNCALGICYGIIGYYKN